MNYGKSKCIWMMRIVPHHLHHPPLQGQGQHVEAQRRGDVWALAASHAVPVHQGHDAALRRTRSGGKRPRIEWECVAQGAKGVQGHLWRGSPAAAVGVEHRDHE